jgi:nicotinic acid mononucleotide adenylyltransferase
MTSVWERLIANGEKMIISEVGMGIPILNTLLSYDGASRILVHGDIPYHQSFEHKEVEGRRCSKDGIVAIAKQNLARLRTILRNAETADTVWHSYAVNGVYRPGDGVSHAWACLATSRGGGPLIIRVMHFWMRMREASRPYIFEASLAAHEWFLEKSFFGTDWKFPESEWRVHVDVLEGVGISLSDQIALLDSGQMIAFQNGRMERAVDLVRQAPRIFRGSFNPPHKDHQRIGNCYRPIFEITAHNRSKGFISHRDLLHRVLMLEKLERPIILSNLPYFRDFHCWLKAQGVRETVVYYVGSDVLSKVVADKDMFTDGLKGLADAWFVVFERDGHAANVSQAREAGLTVDREAARLGGLSSTKARGGDLSIVPPQVERYIRKHGLYGIHNDVPLL